METGRFPNEEKVVTQKKKIVQNDYYHAAGEIQTQDIEKIEGEYIWFGNLERMNDMVSIKMDTVIIFYPSLVQLLHHQMQLENGTTFIWKWREGPQACMP